MRKFISTILMTLMMAQAAFAAEQVLFYHTDPAGTPMAMTNSSGTVVWKADYKPFGEENSTTGPAANDRRFVGKEKDEETGLSYFGARYENAKIGRFIAPDPVRAVDPKTNKTNEKMLANPQRLNTYAYALNSPYRYIDPDGRAPLLSAEDATSNGNVLIGGGGIKSVSEGSLAVRSSGGGNFGIASGQAMGELAELSGMLRNAAKGKGNFGIGSATREQAEAMGKAWVGEGFGVASDGKTLVSADGIRTYRPPSYKPRLDKYQANFETKTPGINRPTSNAHLDVRN